MTKHFFSFVVRCGTIYPNRMLSPQVAPPFAAQHFPLLLSSLSTARLEIDNLRFTESSREVPLPVQEAFLKEFVFAEYVKEIKKAIKGRRASETVISDLYGLVAIPAQLEDRNGDIIACAKTTAFNILHRKANAHLEIQAHSQDAIVVNSIGKNYQTRFEKLFHDAKLPHCLDAIHEAVKDSGLHRDRKQLLLSKFSKESPWDFLGLVFLEVVIVDNKLDEGAGPLHPNETSDEAGLTHSFPKRPMVEQPDDINSEEAVYIAALLEAYGEAESREGFCIGDLP